jgi:hypothetical protein
MAKGNIINHHAGVDMFVRGSRVKQGRAIFHGDPATVARAKAKTVPIINLVPEPVKEERPLLLVDDRPTLNVAPLLPKITEPAVVRIEEPKPAEEPISILAEVEEVVLTKEEVTVADVAESSVKEEVTEETAPEVETNAKTDGGDK